MAIRGGIGDLITDGFATALFGRRETMRIPVRTSSNQAEAIYLPTAAPGLGDSGVIIGREVYSGKGYIYDPFQLYGQQLPAPHWLVLGESGNGKSALEKTYVLRQLRFRDRQVVVLDAQGEDGVGEWNLIAEALGVKPIRLDPHARGGEGIRLNPLDPAITITGQLALLRTIVEVALGHSLDERSGYALKAAHGTVSADALQAGVQPILHDIVDALREPRPEAAAEMNIGLEDVRAWGLDVALVIDRLVDGDLAGMFDGPTSDGIDLDSPLIVFDLSTIDRNSIAMPILMAIVGVWLEHTWLRPDRRKRILLVEEAWHIISQPSVAQLFQRLLKFGRRLGLSFVAVVHHLSDVIDGAAAKEASAILKMASTRTIYMQKSDEARATGRVLGLPRWAVEIIPTLSPGIAVWDVNGDVQVVKHIVTEVEKPLVYTDRAMTESSPRELDPPEVPPALTALTDPDPLEATLPTSPRALAPAPEPVIPTVAHALPLPPTRAVSAMHRAGTQPSALQQARMRQAEQQVHVEVEQVQQPQPPQAPQPISIEVLPPPTPAPRLEAVHQPEPLQPAPTPEALPPVVVPEPEDVLPNKVLNDDDESDTPDEHAPQANPKEDSEPEGPDFLNLSSLSAPTPTQTPTPAPPAAPRPTPTPASASTSASAPEPASAKSPQPTAPAEPVHSTHYAQPTGYVQSAQPPNVQHIDPAAEPPIPAVPALRAVVPPPISAVARPSMDDPELTALAAALFGPRAQTPSHPRRSDDED
jgi:AAA-like domain